MQWTSARFSVFFQHLWKAACFVEQYSLLTLGFELPFHHKHHVPTPRQSAASNLPLHIMAPKSQKATTGPTGPSLASVNSKF